jgi:hypothetical protein
MIELKQFDAGVRQPLAPAGVADIAEHGFNDDHGACFS